MTMFRTAFALLLGVLLSVSIPIERASAGNDGALTVAAAKQGSCSCNIRDDFQSGGRSCQELREEGTCPETYKGVGTDTASCQADARNKAPAACRGCLAHCKFTPAK